MRLFSLFLISLSLLPGLAAAEAERSGPATGRPAATPAQQQLADWIGQLRAYAPVLHTGAARLAALHEPGQVDAALPAIRAVQAGDDALREAARSIEALHFYTDDFVWRDDFEQAMQTLPIGRYHAERARILRAGCYGRLDLYLALTNQEGRFTPEQLAAPLSEAERATLEQAMEVNRLLSAVRTRLDGRKAGEKLMPLVRDISAALPGMNPAALCEMERLRQETDSQLARITSNYLLSSRLLDAMLLQKGSYLADSLMTSGGRFATLSLVIHPGDMSADWPAAKKRLEEFRAAHAEAAAAFFKAHNMTGGDATSPNRAVALPAGLHPAEQRQLLQEFGREVLGESFVPFLDPTPVRERKDGRACTYVAGNAGATGDSNFNGDQTILVPYYFLLP